MFDGEYNNNSISFRTYVLVYAFNVHTCYSCYVITLLVADLVMYTYTVHVLCSIGMDTIDVCGEGRPFGNPKGMLH